MRDEQVVLVDETDQPVGVANKAVVHSDKTPLHRAFSVFIFDESGRVLVQQRALGKQTWPGVWSNSCCGHPKPGETYEAAIKRRVKQELGLEIKGLIKVANYRYKFERDGIVENEMCPVFRGVSQGEVKVDTKEVSEWRWISWNEWQNVLANDRQGIWSPWCKEEVELF